jgi:diguanylate cyclase (GGDEF)-like protein/PAS domain S-box-containing protein
MPNKEISNQSIRKRAEERINSKNTRLSKQLEKLSIDEVQKIVHDLEVYQIELEIQNEELLATEAELEKAKKRYFDLYQMAPISYCTLNQAGLIQEVNFATSTLLGIDKDKLINRPLSDFIFQEDQDIYYMYRKKFFISDKKQECELRMMKADKTIFWAYLTIIGEINIDSEPIFRLLIRDISERKIIEEKLELSASVFKNAGEGIMITDINGVISDVNETFTKITGYAKEEVIGKKPTILSSGLQNKEYYSSMWETLTIDDSWIGELWNKRKDGQLYAQMLIINKVYDKRGKASHFVALFSDITDIKEHENSLKNIAHFDQLTKLPNRVLLADRLENGMIQAKRNNQHLAVIFLDIDGFKGVNDNYGHEVGDKLLITLAKEMKLALREGDTLARIGGDEFVAVLVDLVEISDALPIIIRLLESTTKKVAIGDEWIQVSASLGVTFCPENQVVDADLLLRQADQSMYQAKLSGKNRYHFFNEAENSLIRERFEGIEQVRVALKNEEFILYYQPKINMRTGKVIGAEALIRWKDPQKGIILPFEFLQVIDGHSLSIDVGEWVIHRTLSQIKSWQDMGINIPISVNIGARQLLEEGFANRLKKILSQYPSIKPNMLELEVLETSKFEDLVKTKSVMDTCIKMGVSFSLDDFGTGYSSLVYLKQLPIKQIKIDQSFIRDMLNNPDDLSILEGIISLGEAFQRTVIAEGIESSEHAMILLSLGCELGQGYEIAAPMSVTKFLDWVKEYKPNPLWQNQTLLNSNQRQILFIKVQHRAWIENIKAILNRKENAYRYSIHECTFGKWLEENGKKYLGVAYESINLKHKNIHIYADKLLSLHYNGRNEEALAGLGELYRLRDEILNEFEKKY